MMLQSINTIISLAGCVPPGLLVGSVVCNGGCVQGVVAVMEAVFRGVVAVMEAVFRGSGWL